MTGHSSTYFDELIINHSTRVTPWTPPATLYLALTTIVLTRTDVVMPAGVEMVGLGYVRAAITNGSTFWGPATLNPATGKKVATNTVAVIFANATSDWPVLPGWGVLDAPIGGNVLGSGSFDDQIGFATNGQTPVIEVGSLRLVVSGS